MADPLSIATACVAAVETIASVVITIRGFLDECRAAKSDLRGIQDTLAKLETLFDGIKVEVSGPNSHFIDPTMRSGILGGIHDCTRVMVRIGEVVAEHRGHASKWVRNGKGQVGKLQSSLETYQAVLRLAVSGAKLSLLISVKADTEALRRDVQKLLADRRDQWAAVPDYEPTSPESIITVVVQDIIKSDLSMSKTDSSSEDLSVPSPLATDEGETKTPTSGPPDPPTPKQITCSRLRTVKWDTTLHKTQCVAITPSGDAIALSSMKQISVWDLTPPTTTSSPSRVQKFDDGLHSWHLPSRLAILRSPNDELLVAASSNQCSNWSAKSFESKLLVYNCTTEKTLHTHVKPRRCLGVALSFPVPAGGDPSELAVISSSLKRTYSTLIKLAGRGSIPRESETEFGTSSDRDQRSMGFSTDGGYVVVFSTGIKMPAAHLIRTSSGDDLSWTTLPRRCTPVIAAPAGNGRKAVLVLWHGDTKEAEICTWDTADGHLNGVKCQGLEYAGAAWQRYAISPDCRWVAVCVSTGAVDVIDAGSGAQIVTLRLQDNLPADMGTLKGGLEPTKPNCRGRLMTWSADGGRLVVATRKGAEVWEVRM